MRRIRQFILLLLLYVGVPLALTWGPPYLQSHYGISCRLYVIPALILIAAVFFTIERIAGRVHARELFCLGVSGKDWRAMLMRFLAMAAILTVWLWLVSPESLFAFPKRNPKFWLIVMVCYPVLSVLPQGFLYRWFYERHFAALFSRTGSLLVGALLFAFAHILFRNPYALAFTFVGGLFFLSSYRKTGSVLFSSIEHALFGDFLFTVGWGAYFYEGTQRLAQTLTAATP